MASAPVIALTHLNKLDLLRRFDRFRQWDSLDDKRYCLVCGKIITGQEIQVHSDVCGSSALGLSCPSEDCNSIPFDWVLPTETMLAGAKALTAEEHGPQASTPVSHSRTHCPH